MESLLSLRASVGLMVLAPSPDMCGAVDWRLLEVEDGVCDRCAGDLPGERAWFRGMEPGSGVMDETARCPACCLEGGWKDFALAVRVGFRSLGTAVVMGMRFPDRVSRRLPLFNEGARPSVGTVLSLASLFISCRSKLFVGIIPGPTLFRGARAAGFGGAWAGNWLCRRVRIAMVVGPGGGIEDVSEPEAVDAPLGFRAVDWLKRRMNELLRVGRESVGAPVNACIVLLALLLAGTLLLNVPGAGKSLSVGS
jgi:hypothetical protein